MKTKRLFTDVSEDFHRKAKVYAVSKGLSLKEFLKIAVSEKINKDVRTMPQDKGECCHA